MTAGATIPNPKADFESRAIAHARKTIPELLHGMSDEDILTRLRAVMPRAEQYGLKMEQEIIAFFDTSYLLDDEKFDQNPAFRWTAHLLNNPEYTPREKAAVLIDRATEIYFQQKADILRGLSKDVTDTL